MNKVGSFTLYIHVFTDVLFTCNQKLPDTVQVSFSTSDVKRWTKVDVVRFQLGAAGDHQPHDLHVTWREGGMNKSALEGPLPGPTDPGCRPRGAETL